MKNKCQANISVTTVLEIMLGVLVFSLLVYGITKIFFPAQEEINNKLSCSSGLGVANGACTTKEECGSDNQKTASKDCKNGLICCLSQGEIDTFKPYAGDSQSFIINGISVDNIDTSCSGSANEYSCSANTPVSITFKITTSDKERYLIPIIKIVDIDNNDFSIKEGKTSMSPEGLKLTVEFGNDKYPAKSGNTYTISGGARCITKECLSEAIIINKPHESSNIDVVEDYTNFDERNVVTSYIR